MSKINTVRGASVKPKYEPAPLTEEQKRMQQAHKDLEELAKRNEREKAQREKKDLEELRQKQQQEQQNYVSLAELAARRKTQQQAPNVDPSGIANDPNAVSIAAANLMTTGNLANNNSS